MPYRLLEVISFLPRFELEVLKEKGYALLLATLIAVGGYLLSRLLSALLDRLMQRTGLNDAVRELLVALVRWGTLLLALLFCAGMVATGLFGMTDRWFNAVAWNILRSVGVFLAGFAAIGLVIKALRRILSAGRIDTTLHPFLLSASRILLLVLLSIGCIEILGVSTASLVAALASVGLALSLSAQAHLSNLIGGLVVLISKPFIVGDYIVLDGCEGTVDEITLIYTVLKTFDNKKIFVPNNDAAKAKISNYSAEEHRRLDLTFSIGYHDDYDLARSLILTAAQQSGLLLPEPEPIVRMSAHSASAVEIACRLWVRWSDFYELGYYMRESVKRSFDEAGITIPYQQIDLHIQSADSQQHTSGGPS